jgi:hypothetical protein
MFFNFMNLNLSFYNYLYLIFYKNCKKFKKIKNYFTIYKKLGIKIFKIIQKIQNFQRCVFKIPSFKFQPFFIKKEMTEKAMGKKKNLNKKFFQNIFEQKNRKIFNRAEIYFFFLEFKKSICIKDKKIPNNLKNILFNNHFEETRDTLKFYLDPKLIKLSISRNNNLARCWLFNPLPNVKNKNFWFNYFFSCFNSMIKMQNFSEKIYANENFRSNHDLQHSDKLDFEFFNFSENYKENLKMSLLDFFFQNSLEKFEKKIESIDLIDEKQFFFHWRNRNFGKVFFKMEKKYKKKTNMNFFIFLG